MKISMFLFILVAGISGFSCEDKSDCYKFNVTKDECETKPGCTYHQSGINIKYFDNKIVGVGGLLQGWGLDYTQSYTGICTEKSNIFKQPIPECGNEGYPPCIEGPHWCLPLNQFVSVIIETINPPSSEWVSCDSIGFGVDYVERNVCGNGIIEPGEQCDGEQLGTMSSCTEHGALLDKGPYTSGTITCTNMCKWNYTGCQ